MRLGIVVIGRNEARHLEGVLRAVRDATEHVVYADSASSDDSAQIAEQMGVRTLRLDASAPLSAARGRNEGRALLRDLCPSIEYLQFVDGDTELEPTWLARSVAFLDANCDVGVVAGRLREKRRDRNLYHRLADMEFDTSIGDVDAIGGIAMYRAEAFDEASGFDPLVVSGEERELCARIKLSGSRVVRLSDSMAYHDIDMDEFTEWWSRAARAGQTYAEHWLDRGIMGRKVLSISLWGGALPAAAFGLALPSLGLSLGLLSPYAVLWRKLRREALLRGYSNEDAALFAAAMIFVKIPELAGMARVVWRRFGR
jgi:GT2 family glycosyltransferase